MSKLEHEAQFIFCNNKLGYFNIYFVLCNINIQYRVQVMSANLSWIIFTTWKHCIETDLHFHMTFTNIYIHKIKETGPSTSVSYTRISVMAVRYLILARFAGLSFTQINLII